ncbi:MAG TPA: ECF-type sigma factor [Thermoanaerobaculia bacterium]|nr:ECF-type sigma factor [Thermoanaerobaculia bacterium]
MRSSEGAKIARILDAVARGETDAAARLLPLVYEELRRLARARMARLGPGQTLTPTELVHEAYLRVAGGKHDSFEGRRHFFFAVSRAMRDLIVESARRKGSLKRGGNSLRLSLETAEIAIESPQENVLALDLALQKLERESPDRARVVQLSYFGGLTHPEIAQVLGLSRATVERRWSYARIWLRRELSPPSACRHE